MKMKKLLAVFTSLSLMAGSFSPVYAADVFTDDATVEMSVEEEDSSADGSVELTTESEDVSGEESTDISLEDDGQSDNGEDAGFFDDGTASAADENPDTIADESEENKNTVSADGITYSIQEDEQGTTASVQKISEAVAVIIPFEITVNDAKIPVTAVNKDAFADCTGLQQVFIPDSVASIEADTFADFAQQIVIYCGKDSCAEKYAVDNQLEYKTDGLRIVTDSTQMAVSETVSLGFERDLLQEVTTAGSPILKWKSSDENVATIDENGLVTAVSEGSVILTCEMGITAELEMQVVSDEVQAEEVQEDAGEEIETEADAENQTDELSDDENVTEEEEPDAAGGEGYVWPVPSSRDRITTHFSSGHTAIDIAAPKGSPVIATKSGTIKKFYNSCWHQSAGIVNCNHGYNDGTKGIGNGVYILNDDGTWAEYPHMMQNSFPANVHWGAHVTQGQFLGRVGDSGNADGAHLHFGIRTGSPSNFWNATPVNNEKWMINYIYTSGGGDIPVQNSSAQQVGDGSDYVDNTGFSRSARCYNPSGARIEDLGMVLMNANGAEIKTSHEAAHPYGVGSYQSSALIHENTKTDLNITLTPGTTYKYKFFIKTNGKNYFSDTYTIKTTGVSKPSTPNLSVNKTDIAAGDNVTVSWGADSSAAYGYEVTVKSLTGPEYANTVQVQGQNSTNVTLMLPNAGTYQVTAIAKGQVNSDVAKLNRTLTAHDPSTVVFQQTNEDGQQEILRTETVRYGYNATAPTAPTMEGHTFQGWDRAYSNITGDLTVNAKYKINTYTVTFVNDDGTKLKEETVEYKTCVEAPENPTSNRTGYIFAGWNSNDYTCVKKNMTITASYVWNNMKLPIVVTMNSCKYEEDGYTVNYDITNYPDSKTRGRAIVSLKTSTGKLLVTTESNAFTIPKDTTKKGQEVFVPYEGVASVAEIVIVDSFSSGIPLSVSSSQTINRDWSDWQEKEPEGNYEVEQRTEYRYRDKLTTTSNNSYLDGWTQTGATESWGDYGAWSGWSRTAYSNSASRKVETRTVTDTPGYTLNKFYFYRYWNSSASKYYYTYSSNMGGTKYTYNERQGIDTSMRVFGTYSGHTGYVPNGNKFYFSDELWFLEGSSYVQPVTHVEYRYADRSKVYTYTHEKWSDWSSWSTDEATASGTKEVETRTVYRYKATTQDTEDISGTQRTASGKLSADFAGKQIMLVVFKGAEPADYNNEFVGQSVVGEDGSYSFTYTTREEPSAVTGDFTVCLALEGSTELVYLDTIQAPKPVYTVKFVDEDGNVISTQEVTEGGTAELPANPQKENYRFIGWSSGNTNIRYDLTIVARYEKESFVVNWVDWDRQKIQTETYEYGDQLVIPVSPNVTGYEMTGWFDAAGNPVTSETEVTGNMTLTSRYVRKKYTVNFYDADAEVLSTEEVEYGQAANAPEAPTKDGMSFMGWNNADYLNVTSDMAVYPMFAYLETAKTPVADVESGKLSDVTTVHLTGEEGALIYYTTDGSTPDQYSTEYTSDGIQVSANTILKYVAYEKNKNVSELGSSFYQILKTEDTDGAIVIKDSTSLEKAEKGKVIDTKSLYTLFRTDDGSKTVNIYSLDPSVASVTEEGKIQPNNAGTTKIIFMTADRKYANSCTINVTDTTVPVEKVTSNRCTLYMEPEESEKIKVSVYPEDATDTSLEWYTEDEDIASVGADGTVTANACGSTIVRAYVADGSHYTECVVTVSDPSVVLTEDVIAMDTESTHQLEYYVNGTISEKFSWSTDNYKVATVDENGNVTAVTSGKAVITLKSESGTYEAKCTVIVTEPEEIQQTDIGAATVTFNKEEFTYTGKAILPEITVTLLGKTLIEGTDYQTVCSNNINAGEVKVSLVGMSKYTGIVEKTFTIAAKNLSECEVSEIVDQQYTGIPIAPAVQVRDGNTELTLNEDYAVTYENNTKPGTAKAIITAKGNYQGTAEKLFTIQGISLNGISLNKTEGSMEKGDEEKIIVTLNPVNTTDSVDIQWTSSEPEVASVTDGVVKALEAGTTVITAAVKGTSISAEYTLKVTDSTLDTRTDLSNAEITVNGNLEYNGTEQIPSVTVKVNGTALKEGNDYTLLCENNINAGKGLLYVVGQNDYKGVAKKEFEISRQNIKSAKFSEIAKQTYTGKEISPAVTLTAGETELVLNQDYVLEYTDNTEPGTAHVKATGIGNYQGTVTADYEIQGITLEGIALVNKTEEIYKGQEKELKVLLTPANTTDKVEIEWESSDDTVATITEKGILTALKAGKTVVTAKVKGTTTEASCTVTVKEVTGNAGISILKTQITVAGGMTYTGAECKAEVTVTFGNQKLTEGKDYELIYSNNINAGTATVYVVGLNDYTGIVQKTFTIEPENIIQIKLPTIAEQTYTGKPISPAVQLPGLVSGRDYTVEYASNTNVGTAIIIVKGTGNYAGEATIRFNIKSAPVPKPSTPAVKPITPKPAAPTPVVKKPVTVNGTTLSSVKNTKTRKMTVKWKKNKAVNGYQIQYSTNKKFTSGSKTVTVNKNSTVSKTVKKLKKGKKYYVRIRTYKTVNGKKYYSSWSKAKSVKIKK